MKMFFRLLILLFLPIVMLANEITLFWWKPKDNINFGDYLSLVVVEKILNKKVKNICFLKKDLNKKLLFGIGSILHFARNGDVIWGAGFREDPMSEKGRFANLNVKAVRGPLTRQYLLKLDIDCPEVYGDPALLLPVLFPEFKKAENPIYDYIIIPNRAEIEFFENYKNVVSPLESWDVIVRKILNSKLVISSSLHGLIVAEAFGVPARLIKMTWGESLLKYDDYYQSTGRKKFNFATSVQEAIILGGEPPLEFDFDKLLNSFPYELYVEKH